MIDKGVKIVQLLSKIPGSKKFVKKALQKIEAKSPGYKKFQKKLDDMLSKQTEKLAKEQKVKPSSAKFSDKDIDKGIAKEDRIIKQYESKKSKIFKEADNFSLGGTVSKKIGIQVKGDKKIRIF